MRQPREYTAEQIAETLAALAANGGNISRTSATTGIPRKTISEWRDGTWRKDVTPALVEKKKRDLGDTIERLALRLCDVVSRRVKKASKAAKNSGDAKDQDSAKELLVGLGIVVDKLLLLRGEATSITRTATASTTVDLSRLSKEQLVQLHELHTKARGESLEEASDLSEPVIVEVVPSLEEKKEENTNNASEINDGIASSS